MKTYYDGNYAVSFDFFIKNYDSSKDNVKNK